jgi:hypothetical protein
MPSSSQATSPRFLTYREAKALVHQVGISSFEEYRQVYRHHPGLPSTPNKQYHQDWEGWPGFLQRSTRSFLYLPYAQAQRLAQAQGWRTARHYQAGYRQYPGLPQAPQQVYGELWSGWRAFLNQPAPPVRLSYEEAVALVQTLHIPTSTEYVARYKNHPGLPFSPPVAYAEEWPGWTAFLRGGKGFFTYDEATAYLAAHRVSRREHYLRLARAELRLPRTPEQVYRADWHGWPAFLNRPKRGG